MQRRVPNTALSLSKGRLQGAVEAAWFDKLTTRVEGPYHGTGRTTRLWNVE